MLNKLLKIFKIKIQKLDEAHIPWPTSFSTVDIAVVDEQRKFILLGRKPGKDYWVFPGGFTDPSSETDEEDAVRELFEETNLKISKERLQYLGNFKIDDLRYKGTPHGIRTHFFLTFEDSYRIFPEAGDDLEEVRWFTFEQADKEIGIRHKILLETLKKKIGEVS